MGHHPQNTRHTGEGRYLLPRRDKKTTPALRATPPPEGNLVRGRKKQARRRRASLLSALCALLSGKDDTPALRATPTRAPRNC